MKYLLKLNEFQLLLIILLGIFVVIPILVMNITAYIHNYNSVGYLAELPDDELQKRLSELGVKECRGTFINKNPFEREYIAVYIYEIKQDDDNITWYQTKFAPRYSFNSYTASDFNNYTDTDCITVTRTQAKYQ